MVPLTKKEKGRRISIWIPENQYWMFDAISVLQRRIENRDGIAMSQGEIVRYLLALYLKGYTEHD